MSKRKQFTPEQKVAMVRRHLVENVPVSDLCDELGIHPTQYYNWQKQLFEHGQGAFARRPNRQEMGTGPVIEKLGNICMVRTTQPDPDAAGPLESPVTQYAYDAAGQLTSVTDPLDRVTRPVKIVDR